MRQIFGGALLAVVGIAAFIEAHRHAPGSITTPYDRGPDVLYRSAATGLSTTAYDILRIGAWALVICGSLLVVVGLISFWSATREGRAA
jgi:hypothetical protein